MEAATIPDETTLEKGAVEQASDAAKSPERMWRWSAWVHIGPGAEDCAKAETGDCEDEDHVHAWCRLPNQFQHADISQRAQAAKARRLRQLRDPESDSHVILENAMEELLATGDRETLIDELIGVDFWKDRLDIMREMEEDEEWSTIDQDRERLTQIETMDPEKQPEEERDELRRHLDRYNEALNARQEQGQKPRREAMANLSMEQLVDQVRKDRISSDASSVFLESYYKWEWFSGTYRKPKGEKLFSSIEELEAADELVLERLRGTYIEMEAAMQRGTSGNS